MPRESQESCSLVHVNPRSGKMAKTILVTGCSAGGIGAALAQALAAQGHNVFATARNTSKIPPELRALSNVSVLALDVSSASSVADAAKAVREAGKGLDVLVNNAGIGYTMPVLDIDVDKAKRLYEANVWGPIRTIQAFSDLLMASKGRIVNVSILTTPTSASYASSKAALNSVSETLRLELSPFGVSVVTVNLGTVATSFHANEPTPELPPTSHYTGILDTITKWAKGEAGPKGGPIKDLVNSVVPDVLGEGTGGVVWRGPNSGAVRFLSRWMPVWLLDMMMSNDQGLDELSKALKAKSD
ncbi:oxidoreductase, short-chain dehydrogenase/reductase family [Purpureocillium lavendulum]|uniref:Oxidoreductase, short-chain dehydrogenase/reductase family n=1 Tax=Purpureocillium lavendulum TaxID=1247861 RepID=A0AB34G303_9HYPO|nr:oxidoreductase, short-chain dehydrogenase/reductase family [Purpureocillium lavendulum]